MIEETMLQEAAEQLRPFLSTSFEDYTVTEGLLLFIFVLLLILVFLDLIHWR